MPSRSPPRTDQPIAARGDTPTLGALEVDGLGDPWLTIDRPELLQRVLIEGGWIDPAEPITRLDRAGQGNMNLVLRVTTPRRTLIVKQARPWVEKYPSIAAPLDRSFHEAGFYRAVQQSPGLSGRMPVLLGVVPGRFLIVLENLGPASDATALYGGLSLDRAIEPMLLGLAQWLAELHRLQIPEDQQGGLENRALRRLNHQHLFVIPYAEPPAIELDAVTPGLAAATHSIRVDGGVRRAALGLGELYLGSGPSLLHGDFFPGSWLLTATGPKVIDPEFCFLGPPEFDLGVMLAHLRICGVEPGLIDACLASYRANGPTINRPLAEAFAAAEVLRRLLGVAQLPLAGSLESKLALLNEAAGRLRGF